MVDFARIKRELRGSAIALMMVLTMTAVSYVLIRYLDLRRGSVLYLVPVLLAGWHLGLVPALVAAVGGVLWSGYFFYFPNYIDYIARPFEVINAAVFMIVAVVTSHLATSMKKQTELARKHESQMSDLYAFSRRLAAAPSAADIYSAIEEHLATLAQRKVVLIGTGATGDGQATPDLSALPAAVCNAITELQRGSMSETTIDDRTGNTWLVRPVSSRMPEFGLIAVDLGNVPATAVSEVRQRINDLLSDAAATLERLDLAHALNEAKMRSETELLREALIGSVSHELRTPLASILGAATVLSKSPAIADDERLNSLAGVVRDEAERLNNDIQNLLDATRISRQQVKPRMEWIEPVDIVNSALERRKRRLGGHKVSLDLDSNLPLIYVDPVLVEQAFVQVIDNAAKYSPLGSSINVSAKRNGHDVLLSVNDAGAGLTADETEHLGERFFRGARHTTTISGSGLGLWIARAFVVANGGKVQATSAGIDQGTTVTIHLPLAMNAPEHEAGTDD